MKDDFIDQLVIETMNQSEQCPDDNVISLQDYFEKKTNPIEIAQRRHPIENIDGELLKMDLPFCIGEYVEHKKAISINHNASPIEIPINWSEFSMLKPEETFSFFAMDKDIDQADLLNLFSDMMAENLFAVLGVLRAKKFYLIGFRHDEVPLMNQVLEMTKGLRTYRKIA
jgi:hypothetical protein